MRLALAVMLAGCASAPAQEPPPPPSCECDLPPTVEILNTDNALEMSVPDAPEMSLPPPDAHPEAPAMIAAVDNVVLFDHFTGSIVDPSRWDVILGNPTVVEDSQNDGLGALHMISGPSIMRTKLLALNTRDFIFSTRVRTLSRHPSAIFRIGLRNGSPSGLDIQFAVNGTNGWWDIIVNGATVTPGTAPIVSSIYAEFKITRTANVLKFYVNGAAILSMPYTSNLSRATLSIETISSPPSSTAMVTRLDSVLLSVAK